MKAVKRPRKAARKRPRKPPTFKPSTIKLVKRLAKAHEAGEPIDEQDRTQLRIDLAVAKSPRLTELFRNMTKRPWHKMGKHIAADPQWTGLATMLLAMLLTDVRPSREIINLVIDLMGVWDMDFDAISKTGDWRAATSGAA